MNEVTAVKEAIEIGVIAQTLAEAVNVADATVAEALTEGPTNHGTVMREAMTTDHRMVEIKTRPIAVTEVSVQNESLS